MDGGRGRGREEGATEEGRREGRGRDGRERERQREKERERERERERGRDRGGLAPEVLLAVALLLVRVLEEAHLVRVLLDLRREALPRPRERDWQLRKQQLR